MIRSLVYLCFIILIHFVGSSSTFDHDVEDVVSYLVANSERGALLRRRRLDGPYYQDGTGCEGTLLSGRRRELTEYMYKNPEIVQHIQRHRELTQSCPDDRPTVRADFCGFFTDTGGARLTLFADTFGTRRQDSNGNWVGNTLWWSTSSNHTREVYPVNTSSVPFSVSA